MTEKKYNINELLDEKKHLEEQILEKVNVSPRDLTFIKEKTIDRQNKDNNRELILKPRVSLEVFSQVYNGYVNQLAKVKTAIQKFNADQVAELLQNRDAVRNKILFLKSIKTHLPEDLVKSRSTISSDKDGSPIEILETINEPMFELLDVDKQLDKFCAEERKLNTDIQKLNLDAEITLS